MTQSAAACLFAYPESNPPRRVHVRWPSSQSTALSVGEQSAELLIHAP